MNHFSITSNGRKLSGYLRVLLTLALLLAPARAADLEALGDYFRKALRDWQVPGMSVVIVKDDQVLLATGYGVRELGKAEKVDEHTLFAIASNTKAFTAAAMAMLVHKGKLNWDDRVQQHLPWFEVFQDPWISHEVRLDDLLCHRIGFRTFSGDLIWWNTPYSARETVQRARFLKPQFSFRRGYGYSNIMFIAAGEVVAQAAGQNWADFIRGEILNPLGMTNTAVKVSELKHRPNVATPHSHEEDGAPVPIQWQEWDSTAAAGGIISSAADLAQWLRLQLAQGELEGRTYWTPPLAWKMWSVHNPLPFSLDGMEKNPEFSSTGAGLGWFIAEYRGEFVIRHGGGYDGMFSHTVLAPKKKIGIVVLSNGMTALPRAAAFYALDTLLGKAERDWSAEAFKTATEERQKKAEAKEKQKSERNPDTKPSLPLENYTGRYGGEMYGDATIALEGDKLVLRFLPNPELAGELVHWEHDVFEIRWFKKFAWFGNGKVQILLDMEGRPAEFKMHVPNEDFWFEELEFKRKESAQ